MSFTPEQIAAAQERMKNMSADEITAEMGRMGAYPPQMSEMGMNPAMVQSAMNMMRNNPEMMKQYAEQMKNMSPEQIGNMANMLRGRAAKADEPKEKGKALFSGRAAKADKLKEEGKALFMDKNIQDALDKFEDAILELDEHEDSLKGPPDENITKLREACHLNAAACYLKLKSYKKAIRECSAVLQKAQSAKALFRRATAKKFMGTKDDIKSAILDLEKACSIDKNWKKKCQQLLDELRTTANKMGIEMKTNDTKQNGLESKGNAADASIKSTGMQAKFKHAGDPSLLSIKELKRLLDNKAIDYSGTTEKPELVKLVVKHCALESKGESKSDSKGNANAYNDGKEGNESNVLVEDVSENIPETSKSSIETKNSAPQIDLNVARQHISKMSPEQMRMQAQMMRSMDPNTIRTMNPMMANFSDEQIRMAADNMERMADDPEQARVQMRMASEMMKKLDSNQLHDLAKLQSSFRSSQTTTSIPNSSNTNATSASSTHEPAHTPVHTPQFGNLSSQQAQAMKMMENMDPNQLKALMQMQRDMLKKNPEMFEQMKASNPAMAGMSREDMEQRLNMLADMDEQQLKTMMGMAQKVSKVLQPLLSAWKKFDKAVYGQGKNIMIAVGSISVYYLVNYFVS